MKFYVATKDIPREYNRTGRMIFNEYIACESSLDGIPCISTFNRSEEFICDLDSETAKLFRVHDEFNLFYNELKSELNIDYSYIDSGFIIVRLISDDIKVLDVKLKIKELSRKYKVNHFIDSDCFRIEM